MITLLDLCVSSLRRGHANLLCIVPILTDDPRRESKTLKKQAQEILNNNITHHCHLQTDCGVGRKASIVGRSEKWPTPGASAPRLHVQPCGPVSWNLHHSRKYMRGPSLSGGSCCGNCHALHTRARSGTTAIVAQCVMQHLGYDPGRTRTCNLRFRGPTPYPLGHRASCSRRDPTTLKIVFFQAAPPCSRPLAARLPSPSSRRSRGEDGRAVDGIGVADPCGRACGHDGGHADDVRAAPGLRLAAC